MDPSKQTPNEDSLEAEITPREQSIAPEIDGGVVHEEDLPAGSVQKKPLRTRIKQLWKQLNVYLLFFLLLVVIAVIIFIVAYINSQRENSSQPPELQDLSQEDLKNIASGNANIGDPKYLLNIQSDAIFAGNALVKGDLNVAGGIQLGQGLAVSTLSVSDTANLGTVQINNLSVAGATSLQGRLSIQDELTVGRSLSVGGSLNAAQISTGSLTLSGNGSLTINNHLSAGGQTPARSQGNAVGSGGTTSISGSDLAGTLNVNTGGSPPAGCFATLTFAQRYNSTPHVIISPVGATAGSIDYYVDRSPTSFSICTASAAPAGRNFAFDYFIVN